MHPVPAEALNSHTPHAAMLRAPGYRPELDVVRFVAFFLVFLHHFLPPLQLDARRAASLPLPLDLRVRLALTETCAMGLCLFFTLSAYLIAGLLLRERELTATVSVRNFYLRRILRIWPLYFFGIAIGIALSLVLHQKSDLTAFAWYLLFAGNFYCAAHGWLHNPMNPLWSISIEEQFYLLWPWAAQRFRSRGLSVCALLFIVAANVVLFRLGSRHADTDTSVWANTFVQFEVFAAGILLALAHRRLPRTSVGRGSICIAAGPVLWFASCFLFGSKQPAVAGPAAGGADLMAGYALIALGCASILHGFCLLGPSRMPRWAAYMGKISFGLYVYHLLAIEFAKAFCGGLHGWPYLAASAALALLLTTSAAVASYTLLETPFLRLKRRFEAVHSRPI